MGFAFGEDGAAGSTAFGGMEIQAHIEGKHVSERDFIYGCICLAFDLLAHHMRAAEAASILKKHIDHAAAAFERRQSPKDTGKGRG